MKIPFLDLKGPYLELKEELDGAYLRVMESGWYILGQSVERFEAALATTVSRRFSIGCASVKPTAAPRWPRSRATSQTAERAPSRSP